jgi:hypothetical protein
MGRKPVFRQDVSRPSCGCYHVVKCGRPFLPSESMCKEGEY